MGSPDRAQLRGRGAAQGSGLSVPAPSSPAAPRAGQGAPAALPGEPASYIELGVLGELPSCIFTGNYE